MRKVICIIFLISSILRFPIFSQERFTVEYRIGPRDLIEINVLGEEKFNNLRVRVSEDGTIAIPYLTAKSEVKIEGFTVAELENKLTEVFRENYYRNPQVTVLIIEYLSKMARLMGAVGNPGAYPLIGRQRLLDVVIQAGGITQEAGPKIFISRENADGTSVQLDISIERLFEDFDMTLNIPLQPNDIVFVPIDKIVSIYVGGQISSPGVIQVPNSKIPTLLRAIIQAGGFIERSNQKNVILKRIGVDGKETRREYNVKDMIAGKAEDILLQAGDIIYVQKSAF